jgi:hypothetical protein
MNDRERHEDVRQERDNPPWGRMLLVALAALGLSAILVVWSWVLLLDRQQALRVPAALPAAPLLERPEISTVQRVPFGEMGPGQRLNRRKRDALTSFSWADRDRGLVNIPIEDAMQLVVEEGRQ